MDLGVFIFSKKQFSAIECRLNRLERKLSDVSFMMRQVTNALNISVKMEIMQMLDDLKREIAETKGDYESAKKLIAGLSQRLQEMASAPAAGGTTDVNQLRSEIGNLASELNAMQEDFASAVTSPGTPGGTGASGGGAGPNE